KDANFICQRGMAYVKLKKTDEANRDFDAALKLAPQLANQVHLGRVELLYDTEKWAEALTECEAVLKALPKSVEGLTWRGMIAMRQGDTTKAKADFDKALELNPNFHSARANRGATLLEMGKNYDAVQDFNVVLEKTPNSAYSLTLRGIAYVKQGNYLAAV